MDDNVFGNDNSCMQLANDGMPDYTISNHGSTPGFELDCNSTGNTHTGTGSNLLACTNYNNEMITIWMRASRSCMNNVIIQICDRSLGSNGIVMVQCNKIDNSMLGNEMKICHSLIRLAMSSVLGIQTERGYVTKRGKLFVDLSLVIRILI